MFTTQKRNDKPLSGFLMVDAMIALTILTTGFLFLQRSAVQQVERSRARHEQVLADVAVENDVVDRWTK